MKSSLSDFSFMDCATSVVRKKSWPNLRWQSLPSMFSFSFILGFTLYDPFAVNFYGVWGLGRGSLFTCSYLFVPATILIFSIEMPLYLSQKLVDQIWLCLFLDSSSCSISGCVSFPRYHTIALEKVITSQCEFPNFIGLRAIVASQFPLPFHIHFRISLSIWAPMSSPFLASANLLRFPKPCIWSDRKSHCFCLPALRQSLSCWALTPLIGSP